MEKSAKAGAVISLVGAPQLKEGEAARLTSTHPPVLVVATASLGDKMGVHTDPVRLASLLEDKLIQLAIIDGNDPTPQLTTKPDPHRLLFAQHYRILRLWSRFARFLLTFRSNSHAPRWRSLKSRPLARIRMINQNISVAFRRTRLQIHPTSWSTTQIIEGPLNSRREIVGHRNLDGWGLW
jgi:hypothetical protein